MRVFVTRLIPEAGLTLLRREAEVEVWPGPEEGAPPKEEVIRGVKKADAAIDQWVKDIAPSTAMRKWFGHDHARWQEFRSRYAVEVYKHPEQLNRLRALARQGPVTLVFSAHDEVHNDAVALRSFLLGRQTKRKPTTAKPKA